MTMTTVSIALMNTLFRLATVIVLAPLIGVLEKCVCLLIPENPESIREEQEMDRLEERFLLHPALALEQAGPDGTVLCYGSLYLIGDVELQLRELRK
jgi:phosphate:Na+ symporter